MNRSNFFYKIENIDTVLLELRKDYTSSKFSNYLKELYSNEIEC